MVSSAYKLVLVSLMGCMIGACSTVKQPKVVVTPSVQQITIGENHKAQVAASIGLNAEDVPQRSRLVLIPRVMHHQQQLAALDSIAVDGAVFHKKIQRRVKLAAFSDRFEPHVYQFVNDTLTIPFNQTLTFPEDIRDARLELTLESLGCGKVAAMDTTLVACFHKPEIIDTFSLKWIEPEIVMQPKVMNGKGVAHLQFLINDSRIDVAMGNNQYELEGMEQKLSPVLQDTLATIREIHISGMASADGPLQLNINLAYDRALSAKKWLVERLALPPHTQELVRVDSRPEGWLPVLASMREAGDPDTLQVQQVLQKYNVENDDVAERYIRRLPCWNRIKKHYLQKNRGVEYVYSYTIKSFSSDTELRQMSQQRPDAFSEMEFLRLAGLMETLTQKIAVYETLVKYYPDSKIGKNNLAVLQHELAVKKGKENR